MVNYKNGKIYKIQCNKTKDIYVGSTCCRLLCQRLRQHVHCYKCYLNGKTTYMTSFKILKDNDYFIELIEKVPCDSKDELHKRERYFIETLECVNKIIPGRTKKEYQKEYQEEHKEEIKEYKKEYYEEHKEELKEYQKEYREEHKEQLSLKKKEYYEDNKEQICLKKKEYREEHKEEIKERNKEYYEDNKEQLCLKKKEYYEDNKEYIKEYKKKLHMYQYSWGGDKRFNNNLLSIDVDLFT